MKNVWKKFKDNLSINKQNISDFFKFIILVGAMTAGFWIIFAFIWFAVGFPQTGWALYLLLAIAFLVEVLYVWWLEN